MSFLILSENRASELQRKFNEAFGYPNSTTQEYGGLYRHNNGNSLMLYIEERCLPFLTSEEINNLQVNPPYNWVPWQVESVREITVESEQSLNPVVFDITVGSFITHIESNIETPFGPGGDYGVAYVGIEEMTQRYGSLSLVTNDSITIWEYAEHPMALLVTLNTSVGYSGKAAIKLHGRFK